MFVLTVKKPGGGTEHFAVEKKVQALTRARQLAALLPIGGSVSILKRMAGGGLQIVGGLLKQNPRRRSNPLAGSEAHRIGRQLEYIHNLLHQTANPRRRRR